MVKWVLHTIMDPDVTLILKYCTKGRCTKAFIMAITNGVHHET